MSPDTSMPDPHNGPNRGLAAAAYERLRYDVLRCVLPLGRRLRLNQLADHCSLGAGVIREALSRRRLREEQVTRKSIKLGGDGWEVGVKRAFRLLVKASESSLPDPRLAPRLLHMREAIFERKDRHRHFYLAYVAGQREHLADHQPRTLMEAALWRHADETVQLLRRYLESTLSSLVAFGIARTIDNDVGVAPNKTGSANR